MIALVENNDFVTRAKFRHEKSDNSCHPARIDDRFLGSVQRGKLSLDNLFVGVSVSTVFFAILLLLDIVDNALRRLERESAAATDGVGDGIARLASSLASVHAGSA